MYVSEFSCICTFTRCVLITYKVSQNSVQQRKGSCAGKNRTEYRELMSDNFDKTSRGKYIDKESRYISLL